MSDSQEFNDGHILEGMDRCHTIQILLEELLEGHPAVIKAEMQRQVVVAQDAVMYVYEAIRQLED